MRLPSALTPGQSIALRLDTGTRRWRGDEVGARQRVRPYDHRGRFVPKDCPECGCGRLQPEGDGYWLCDGLADPGTIDKELECCSFFHVDGEPYRG